MGKQGETLGRAGKVVAAESSAVGTGRAKRELSDWGGAGLGDSVLRKLKKLVF